MRALYLAYRALMAAEPEAPLAGNVRSTDWMADEPIHRRLSAAAVLARRERPDRRVTRAIDLLSEQREEPSVPSAGREETWIT